MKIQDLGFDQWFERHAALIGTDGCRAARITAVDRGAYLLHDGEREVFAELSGKVAYQIEDSGELPCVGDWVSASYYNMDTAAIIHQVLPRKTHLRRKASGEAVEIQMIAANIDTACIVQSCHVDFNPSRLERYLVMATDGHVEPVVVLTKTDLITPNELEQKRAIIGSVTDARVIAICSITGAGFEAFQQTLAPGKTYCLLGSSGVGKTTLLNCLIGRNTFETKAVSGTGEGTHTTTRRQLVFLNNGAMVVDTPGMRELGIIGASEGLDTGFGEMAGLAEKCRYANCTHEHEPGCAVRAAVARGAVPEERYANYLKLKKESEFYGMSYLEKRKKDKAFGRLCKSVKKYTKR